MAAEPTHLQEKVTYFADADNCCEFLMERRLMTLRSRIVATATSTHNRLQRAIHHDRQFSAKNGTVLEDSPISLLDLAVQDELGGVKLCGELVVDETHIGGKSRFMHNSREAEEFFAP